MSTLVAVFAHPDDETFICGGTLAKYAAEGHKIVLVCATKGEMGRRMGIPPTVTRETLAPQREQELRNACHALGVRELAFLGYRDKTLEIQPFAELVNVVLHQLEREQPEVVVTFHEQFGGHADHCTIGAATTAAFQRYAAQHTSARLYFVAWSGMVNKAREYGLDKDEFAEIDVAHHLEAKLYAYRAHKTQSELLAWVWQSEQKSMKKLGNVEYFMAGANARARGASSLFE